MQSPKVSVIVPVYKVEKYLRRCVDSILAQMFTDFELLLIDDGSPDNSGKICDEYAALDPRVRVFHKPNGGVSSARNFGLDNARGEWVAFVDSDDEVFPNWLKIFADNISDDYNLICQGIKTDSVLSASLEENGSSNIYGLNSIGSPEKVLTELFERGILGYVFCKLFRLDLIKERNVVFDEKLFYREDEAFILEYLKKTDVIKSVREYGYYYYTPDWNKKYSNTQNVFLSRKIWTKANVLLPSRKNALRLYLLDEYKQCLMDDIRNCEGLDSDVISELMSLTAQNRGEIRFNPIVKYIIVFDKTLITQKLLFALMKKRFFYKSKKRQNN